MSRKHTHAYARFQLGKGLVGFLAGLVLATMIIIAVLLMLNSNSKRDFKQPTTPNNVVDTQTITPSQPASNPQIDTASDTAIQTVEPIDDNGKAASQPENTNINTQPSVNTDNTVTVDDNGNNTEPLQPNDNPITDKPINEIPPIDNTPPIRVKPSHGNQSGSNANHTTPSRNNNLGNLKNEDLNIPEVDKPKKITPKQPVIEKPPVNAVRPPKTTTTPTEPTKQPSKPVVTKEPTQTTQTTTTPKEPVKKPHTTQPPKKDTDVKPTAQQILDSGNIEKARELARKQASTKNTPKSTDSSTNKKRGAVVIQAGAFGSRNAAESQRARLALLGVQAKVVEASVNGQTTYRVQTNRMDNSQASNTRSVLQRNGVSTLERSAD